MRKRLVGSTALALGALVAAALIFAPPHAATAQQSNFGTIALASGFTPDPHVVSGRSGGNVQARSWNGSCAGWVSAQPDHILTLNTAFAFLRIFAESAQDTTLVVQTPSGQYLCNDDTFGNNPAVSQAFSRGTYRIWIGAYNQTESSPYQLKLTELQNVQPGGGGGGGTAGGVGSAGTRVCGRSQRGRPSCIDANARRTNFGCSRGRRACQLTTGFTPDPWAFRLTAGGGRDPIDVSSLNLRDSADNSACGRSFITAKPDFRFQFAAGQRFPLLRFYVRTGNGADATLLVNTPDARWRCNDDSHGGRMPTIDFRNPAAGRYDVWVGTYDASSRNPAQFFVTELDSNHP